MNKILLISTIGILILGVCFYIFRGEETITNYPPKNGPIVGFGDSLVQGVGAGETENFIALLGARIGEPIINMGVSGNTTRDGLARVGDVIKQNPRIVILLLGGNDYIRRIPKEETFKNLREIITRLQEKGAIVFLLGIRGGILTDGYDDSFESLAEETGSLYVSNVLDGIFGKTELMADGLHPNKEGYKIIAGRVYGELKKVME